MKTIIRHWCFETNSSSSHSFSIADSWDFDNATLTDEWDLIIDFWEYWWEIETYNSVKDKLSYVVTYLFSDLVWKNEDELIKDFENENDWYRYIWDDDNVLEFERKIKEHTWAYNIFYNIWDWWNKFWYIDHQSIDEWKNAYNDLINAVFRKDSYFETDNDNY